MLSRPKRSARYRRIRRRFCIVLLCVLILSAYLEFAVKAQLSDVIGAQVKALAQRAVNTAVAEYLAEHPDAGEKLSDVCYNDSGVVTSVTTDPSSVNALKTSVSTLSQQYIEQYADSEGLSLPLGSFTGFVFLTNTGPAICLDISCRSTVTSTLKSTFESGGVNQTLHHIILTVDVEIVVYNPFRIDRPIHTSADFEISSTVIVGAVPSYALGSFLQ